MTEYIEREALVRQIICNMAEFVGAPDDVLKHDEQCNYAISCVESAPAADVAPVVHCSHCRSYNKPRLGWCSVHLDREGPDDFCGYGVRMDGDSDAAD